MWIFVTFLVTSVMWIFVSYLLANIIQPIATALVLSTWSYVRSALLELCTPFAFGWHFFLICALLLGLCIVYCYWPGVPQGRIRPRRRLSAKKWRSRKRRWDRYKLAQKTPEEQRRLSGRRYYDRAAATKEFWKKWKLYQRWRNSIIRDLRRGLVQRRKIDLFFEKALTDAFKEPTVADWSPDEEYGYSPPPKKKESITDVEEVLPTYGDYINQPQQPSPKYQPFSQYEPLDIAQLMEKLDNPLRIDTNVIGMVPSDHAGVVQSSLQSPIRLCGGSGENDDDVYGFNGDDDIALDEEMSEMAALEAAYVAAEEAESVEVTLALHQSYQEANSKLPPSEQHSSSLFHDVVMEDRRSSGLGSSGLALGSMDLEEIGPINHGNAHLTTYASTNPQNESVEVTLNPNQSNQDWNKSPFNVDNAFKDRGDGPNEVIDPANKENQSSSLVRGLSSGESGGGKRKKGGRGWTPEWVRRNPFSRREPRPDPYAFLNDPPPRSPIERFRDAGSAVKAAVGCALPKSRKPSPAKKPAPKEDAAATRKKSSRRRTKKKKEEPAPEIAEALEGTTHFRDVGDDDKGIDLQEREKFRHFQFNQFRAVQEEYEKQLPNIENEAIKKLFIAVKEFMDEMMKRNYKDTNGKPLIYNVFSLPLGLPADAKVVALLFNYLTLEEGLPIIRSGKKNGYMAMRSDDTVCCNTIEIARRALTDKYFYSFILGDVHPVAYPHESTLEKHVGNKTADAIMKEWKKVLKLLLADEEVKIGLGSKTAHTALEKLIVGKKKYIPLSKIQKKIKKEIEKMKANGRFVSAGKDGGKYEEAAHPCCYYQKSKISNMAMKMEKGTLFYTRLRRVRNPAAPEVTFFQEYYDENSSIFQLCQQAYLEGCSRGGKQKWKNYLAALERKKNGTPEEGDDKLIQAWENFEASWDEARSKGGTNKYKNYLAALERKKNGTPEEGDDEIIKAREDWYSAWKKGRDRFNKKQSEAAKRRKEGRQLDSDKEVIEFIDKRATAGGQGAKEKRDQAAGRTSNTMFLCLICLEKNVYTHNILPKGENTYPRGLLAGMPMVGQGGGRAYCQVCKDQHTSWVFVEKEEEEEVKAKETPKRIEREVIANMCERDGCICKRYKKRNKVFTICEGHKRGRQGFT